MGNPKTLNRTIRKALQIFRTLLLYPLPVDVLYSCACAALAWLHHGSAVAGLKRPTDGKEALREPHVLELEKRQNDAREAEIIAFFNPNERPTFREITFPEPVPGLLQP